jgi:putative methionine-R-sulfoxide reductase with GAF domain
LTLEVAQFRLVVLQPFLQDFVKPYRPTNIVLADISRALTANQPSFHHSPLEDVAELLCEGRHYSWAGIYIKLDARSSPALLQDASEPHPGQIAVAGTRKKIVIAIKIAGRELGFLNVESERENSFGSQDQVLLERVASLLARFLTGRGKYLVRRASRIAPSPRAAAAA